MPEFEYKALPWNIIFGVGVLKRLPEELDKMGLSRALVLSTPFQSEQASEIASLLGDRASGLFDQAVMHVPGETVKAAIKLANSVKADCTVSLGGGSTTGLGKALVLKLDLPNIAIPTTYAGSEMTNIWGMTDNQRKVTGRDVKVLPDLTLYDPELTRTLPTDIAGPSGINAMAQAVVNVATDKPNPMISMMGTEAVRALAVSLPKVIENPDDMEARSDALFGACLAGATLGTGITSLHHRLCHTLGGTYNTPHAETHAILLPHSIAYNAAATPDGTRKLAEAIGHENPALGVFELLEKLGIPRRLADVGIKESDIDNIVETSLEKPLNNPEPVIASRLRNMLKNALYGHPPKAV